jgi:hypothetical protein
MTFFVHFVTTKYELRIVQIPHGFDNWKVRPPHISVGYFQGNALITLQNHTHTPLVHGVTHYRTDNLISRTDIRFSAVLQCVSASSINNTKHNL